MKLELYSIPNNSDSEKIKDFLVKNNIHFKEIIIDNEKSRIELKKLTRQNNISCLKITKSHGIEVIAGFLEFPLQQLIEHIKKYNPKIS